MKHPLAVLGSVASLLIGCSSEVTGGSGSQGGGEASSGAGTGAGGSDESSSGAGTGPVVEPCPEPLSPILEGGAYFLVVDLEQPLPTQVQLLAWLDVDREANTVAARFSNADRSPGPSCGCADGEACSSFGPEGCVLPSTKAASEEEYADFLVSNPDPPEGYSFTTSACTAQAGGVVSLVTEPVDVVIEQPEVTLVQMQLTAQLAVDGGGVLRASGAIQADQLLLGSAEAGPPTGAVVGRTIPADEAPEDLPRP